MRRLHRLDTPLHVDVYGPGTHAWPYWQGEPERALPILLPELRTTRP